MKKFLKYKRGELYILLSIIVLGLVLRLYGINWDQNQHLHPDERFLTMVTQNISWPKTLYEYFDTNTSPLNPHNVGFGFYVYGTFPLFFIKAITQLTNLNTYNSITLVGRFFSAFVDTGTILAIFFLTKKLTKNKTTALLASFSYSICVLPIQLSHFYTVDPYLTFFLTLSFLLLIKLQKLKNLNQQIFISVGLGLVFGLSLASKIQALTFLPIILLGILLFTNKPSSWVDKPNSKTLKFTIMQIPRHKEEMKKILWMLGLFLISGLITVRFFQPYLFSDNSIIPHFNPKIIANWNELKVQYSKETYKNHQLYFPPATMFISAKDYVFPLENIVLWGLGLPMGLFTVIAILVLGGKYLARARDTSLWPILLLLLWTLLSFGYQGQVFAKYLRYFYPIFPFMAIALAIFLTSLKRRKMIITLVYGISFVWTLAFCSIYSRPHSRIQASNWIYNNIEKGSKLGHEVWDDSLPLCLQNQPCGSYIIVDLPLYDLDTKEKWTFVNAQLQEIDYLILSSNRLYGSIMAVSDRYPITNEFYQSLFNGSLGFTKVAEFTSRPNLPLPFGKLCLTPPGVWYGKVALKNQECDLPGVTFVDDYADESFTVYDHPKVIIFKNTNK